MVPQLVNALLSQHNFILLGLRGQAKTRLLRALVTLLDEVHPGDAGLRDQRRPARADLRRVPRAARRPRATDTPIAWLGRDARYVEKLATPDVTIADMVGDIDPIKAARAGLQLSSELTMHYGLLPRANRGIFAINELPDLAGKIQVGLFNILQEGDVQIKGYPVRLPLDVLMAFTANPEDYTARGKIITPLKDRIGSEIRTHYPPAAPTRWRSPRRKRGSTRDGAGPRTEVPALRRRGRRGDRVPGAAGSPHRQAVGRQPAAADLGDGERRLERRAAGAGHERGRGRARVTDIYAALPSITGKFEMEYEGELKGAEDVARELVRAAVATVADGYLSHLEPRQVIEWFDLGGSLQLATRWAPSDVLRQRRAGAGPGRPRARGRRPEERVGRRCWPPASTSCSRGCTRLKKISRSDERGYHAGEHAGAPPDARSRARRRATDADRRDKKKYYN